MNMGINKITNAIFNVPKCSFCIVVVYISPETNILKYTRRRKDMQGANAGAIPPPLRRSPSLYQGRLGAGFRPPFFCSAFSPFYHVISDLWGKCSPIRGGLGGLFSLPPFSQLRKWNFVWFCAVNSQSKAEGCLLPPAPFSKGVPSADGGRLPGLMGKSPGPAGPPPLKRGLFWLFFPSFRNRLSLGKGTCN